MTVTRNSRARDVNADVSPLNLLKAAALRHVFQAFAAYPHICVLRARKCAVSIFKWDVLKPAPAPAAIWRPTVSRARGEPYVPPTTLSRFGDKVSCSDYLCEDTLVCIKRPIECPCRVVQDVKCVVPDTQDAGSGTRLCIRGATNCAQIEKLANKFAM